MPVVNIEINNGIFPIVCDEGQESRLSQLAEKIDIKITSLKESLGQVDEKTKEKMTCLKEFKLNLV